MANDDGSRIYPFYGYVFIISTAFSALGANSIIKRHKHDNPYVTAIVCLQAKGDVYIENGDEKRNLTEGKITVFDYTFEHEVINNSDVERVVL